MTGSNPQVCVAKPSVVHFGGFELHRYFLCFAVLWRAELVLVQATPTNVPNHELFIEDSAFHYPPADHQVFQSANEQAGTSTIHCRFC